MILWTLSGWKLPGTLIIPNRAPAAIELLTHLFLHPHNVSLIIANWALPVGRVGVRPIKAFDAGIDFLCDCRLLDREFPESSLGVAFGHGIWSKFHQILETPGRGKTERKWKQIVRRRRKARSGTCCFAHENCMHI